MDFPLFEQLSFVGTQTAGRSRSPSPYSNYFSNYFCSTPSTLTSRAWGAFLSIRAPAK